MHLVPINIDTIRIGSPLPFPLMDKDGVLLARKSFVVPSRRDLEEISQRGGGLYINVADAEALHRAYVEHLYDLVRDDKSLGEIADTKLSGDALTERQAAQDDRMDWLDLQAICNALLRDTQPLSFRSRLDRLQRQLFRHTKRNPDGTLFALIYLSAAELQMYSATHAMLVSVMCMLAAKEVLNWSEADQQVLGAAALTMNFSMTELQDRLTVQVEAPSPAQRAEIEHHADNTVKLLRKMGVEDSDWLEAITQHHTAPPGPLSPRSRGERFARLIRRADMFAARLAPRASRTPISPAAAMQACYFDEKQGIDETGAAIIKAVGIYQPGSFVRLATNEVAVVIQRGLNTTTPKVAVLLNRSGIPTIEPTIRDTSVRDHRIVASVPHKDVKVQLNLERLLPLTALPKSDRPW
jgi:HD-GYP domain-containing protein (c-di-GMP phosphodiesterase class II)